MSQSSNKVGNESNLPRCVKLKCTCELNFWSDVLRIFLNVNRWAKIYMKYWQTMLDIFDISNLDMAQHKQKAFNKNVEKHKMATV